MIHHKLAGEMIIKSQFCTVYCIGFYGSKLYSEHKFSKQDMNFNSFLSYDIIFIFRNSYIYTETKYMSCV